jgi:hypothetical protein
MKKTYTEISTALISKYKTFLKLQLLLIKCGRFVMYMSIWNLLSFKSNWLPVLRILHASSYKVLCISITSTATVTSILSYHYFSKHTLVSMTMYSKVVSGIELSTNAWKCMRCGGTVPRVLNSSTKWKSVVSFTPKLLHPQGKSPWYLLDRRNQTLVIKTVATLTVLI